MTGAVLCLEIILGIDIIVGTVNFWPSTSILQASSYICDDFIESVCTNAEDKNNLYGLRDRANTITNKIQ